MQSASLVHSHGRDDHFIRAETGEKASILAVKGGSSSIRFAQYELSEPMHGWLERKVDRLRDWLLDCSQILNHRARCNRTARQNEYDPSMGQNMSQIAISDVTGDTP